MIGVQEYRSICCGVVCYVYSNGTYCLTTVTTVATRVVAVVSMLWNIYKSSSSICSITVAWHNIQKHNYYYIYVLYINNV